MTSISEHCRKNGTDVPSTTEGAIRQSNGELLPDSGDRSQFDTGAQRDAMKGKGLPSLIPPQAIRRLAKRFEDGAIKYDRLNWLKGMPLSRFQDAIIRHTMAAAEGQTDEDHLAAIMWNAAAWMETSTRIDSNRLPEALADLPYADPYEVPSPDAQLEFDFDGQ